MKPSIFWDSIKRLEGLRQIGLESDNRKTVFTIENWASYQGRSKKADSYPSASRHQTDTNNNGTMYKGTDILQ